MDRADISLIEDEGALRALYPEPMSRATGKILPALDRHCREILALSPFCLIATQGPGGADVSPKGDPPGFVRVLDDRTILIPDRVGNNRLDGMVNILSDPRVGCLFMVPGMTETLRINGTAAITDDAELLAPCAINDRPPKTGLLIAVEEAFVHCGKSLVRGRIWDPEAQIERGQLASYLQMLRDHVDGLTDEENAAQQVVMDRRGLY